MKGITTNFTAPVHKWYPIPNGMVAYVAGCMGDRPRYVLWKEGVEIVVEAPYHDTSEYLDPNDEFGRWRWMRKIEEEYGNYLEVIQAHIDEIEFGKTNWAYLLRHNGKYYIRQREKKFPAVTCPLWAPIILESEVEFTVYGLAADRRGYWKGKGVDIQYAWDEISLIQLNRAMIVHRAAQGMDLTFELYGHLLKNDGTVVGLVSEAGMGRVVELADRSLIYRTISSIQKQGWLYRGCGTNKFMITPEGKVRLLEVFSLVKYPADERDRLDKDAELWHWMELEQLFNELKEYGPHGYYKLPPARFLVEPNRQHHLVAPPPGPDRPLGGLFFHPTPNFFQTYDIPYWEGYKSVPPRLRKKLKDSTKADNVGDPSCDNATTSGIHTEADGPLTIAKIDRISRAHRRTTRLRIAFHP